jgi:hypothetical protein
MSEPACDPSQQLMQSFAKRVTTTSDSQRAMREQPHQNKTASPNSCQR